MAITIRMHRFHREINQGEFASVLRTIRDAGHRLWISTANDAYFNALGVPVKEAMTSEGTMRYSTNSRFIEGDLIPAEDWSEVAYVGLIQEFEATEAVSSSVAGYAKQFLEAGSISANGQRKLLDSLEAMLPTVLFGEQPTKDTWQGLTWSNEKFAELKKSGSYESPNFTAQEKAVATKLADLQTWKLATAVKASGGMLVKNIGQIGASELDLGTLQQAGLLQKDHVVICRRTSGLINRVSSLDVLKQLDEQGVRCGSCSRKLSDERFDELVAPTDLGRELLDHSRWMAAILMESLDRLSLPGGSVVLEFREGSEEVDAFIDVDGSLVMVELKDREFSMGDAYPLSGRIAMYHPSHVLIVSRDKVAPDVKSYFERIKPEARLVYVESLDLLDKELETVANLARSSKVETLLDYFKPLTLGVDIPRIVASKLGISLPKKQLAMSIGNSFNLPWTYNWRI